MTKLFACVNTYGSPDSLLRTLASLIDKVDGAVIFDGPFAGWPRLPDIGLEPSSLEFGQGPPFPCIYARHGYLLQKTARSQSLQLAAALKPTSDDWLLIIDDDEVLRDGEDLRPSLEVWAADYASINVEDLRFKRRFPQNRLIRWMPGLHYEPNHWTIRSNLGVITRNASPPFFMLEHTGLVNDPEFRSREWLWHRSFYRMLQFIGTETNWRFSRFIEGSDEESRFIDVDKVKELLEGIKKNAANGDEFDLGLLTMLSAINNGSEQDIVAWSPRTRGAIVGLLYAAGVIPFPYAKKKIEAPKQP